MIQTTVAPPFLFRMVELKSSYIFEKKRSYSGTKIIYCALDGFYSSCNTTVHNLTAVNEQMPLDLGNLNFKMQFLFHQLVCNANADIMTIF